MTIARASLAGRSLLFFVVSTLASCASAPEGSGPREDASVPIVDGSDVGAIDAARPDSRTFPDGDPNRITTYYVSVLGVDANSGFEPSAPLRHIAFALTKAVACTPAPCDIRIAQGVYEEAITLASGVDLRGGFSLDFESRDAETYPVVITSDQPRTVIADGLTATTELEALTIRGADLRQDVTGASSYALWVRDCADHLELRRVVVQGGYAGRGVDGTSGILTTCDARGGQGGSANDCGGVDGTSGDAGGDPAGGSGGGRPGTSYCLDACPAVPDQGISDGTPGDNGANGASGDPGAPASDTDGAFEADLFVGAAGASGARGLHGTGGGGGGPGGTKRFRACFGCGSLIGGRGGDGGRGGCGGNGGESGGAGGGSIAVVIIGSTVKAEQVAITGGVGGRGGNGGDGHAGGPGNADGSIGRGGRAGARCGLINYQGGAGGWGGAGGAGGHGGGGPGGIGGASVGVALVNGGQLEYGEPGSVGIQAGTGGAGGVGGSGVATAAPGLVGAAADIVIY
jgi:hypothetical protein